MGAAARASEASACGLRCAGWKGILASGATLVYFHSSSRVVGKPNSPNREIAACRIGKVHDCPSLAMSFSSWAKFAR
jgi:hypothetical protein